MKFFSKFKFVFILCSISVAFFSCEEKDEKTHPDYREGTILKTAYKDSTLTTFVDALLITNLSELLVKNEPYTVFAPTNKAFNKFFIKSSYYVANSEISKSNEASLDKIPVNLLKQLLLNHIVLGNIKSSTIGTGYVKTLAKSSISQNNTMSMYINTATGIRLNGMATVTTTDITAINGTIHIVDGVLDFPLMQTHLELNPKLSDMNNFVKNNAGATLLEQISLPKFYEKDKQQYFSKINPLTIYAPTNDAFAALNSELASSGGLASVSTTNLNKIFLYHTVSQNMLSSAWVNNNSVSSLLSLPLVPPENKLIFESFTTQTSSGKKIVDVRNRVSEVETTDIQCWNGVIHVVNKVFLPNF
jgi:uncharacterized surface protein with fasciclin (FAS1) repeats